MLAIWNAIRNATPLQILGAVLVLNSALTGSLNELTDLFGQVWAKHLLSIATVGSGVCGGLVTMFGGQGAQVKNVLAMKGVENIDINGQANQTLAALAVDPAVNKIRPTAAALESVTATAKG